MTRRHVPPVSVRPERTLTRAGLWATGPTQLQLPFEATGLSERISANGRLKLSPDYDVFAWLCERWQSRPTDTGWMRPTLYEIGSALYGKAPSGENYRDLREALVRLAMVRVTIDGYDVETGDFRDNWIVTESLMAVGRPKDDPTGLDRPSIRIAEWLRQALDEEKVVRVHWQTLRAFDERQKLAKRLWLYLAAERWSKMTADSEGTWIACGDRLSAALGMDYDLTLQEIVAQGRYHKDLDLIDAVMEGPDNPEDDPEYFRRIAAREAFARATVNVMARNRIDALIYPTAQVAAPTMAGRKDWTTLTFPTNTLIASQTWSPAITVPAGFTDNGLPVGLEFVAAPYDEPTVFRLAYAFEQATKHRRSPSPTLTAA